MNQYKQPTIDLILHLLEDAYGKEKQLDSLLAYLSDNAIKELKRILMKLSKDKKIDLTEKVNLEENPALLGELRKIEAQKWWDFTNYIWMGTQIIKDSMIETYQNTVINTFAIFQDPKASYSRIQPKYFEPRIDITPSGLTQRVIDIPWCQDGKTYSERLYSNVKNFYSKLNFVLEQGIREGKGLEWMEEAWRKLTASSAYDTARLLKTETIAMWSLATKETYLNLGIEYVEIVGDAACGSICTDYVGEVLPLADAELGDELPPYHPNCACSYVAYIDQKEDEG